MNRRFPHRRPEDQAKIRFAVGLRQVDPKDVPPSAKTPATAGPSAAKAGPSQLKRKAEFEAKYGSQQPAASKSIPSQSKAQALSTQTQHLRGLVNKPIIVDDEEEENVPDDAPIDELYVTSRTNIVGVQYYKGESRCGVSRSHSDHPARAQVWLERAKKLG